MPEVTEFHLTELKKVVPHHPGTITFATGRPNSPLIHLTWYRGELYAFEPGYHYGKLVLEVVVPKAIPEHTDGPDGPDDWEYSIPTRKYSLEFLFSDVMMEMIL